ncbi:hypothetical protein CU313_03650 [Prochlorococcus marinus str. MU1404]|uniref:hypothetical protein n=1 Tax=Prochlorococcus marinus TaxID=1219 RepID=UPI001ADA3C00|nr:hypothetical protein [Prochlorococcus marinus]MBO8230392.1 hypothetical protein [Prochlorococcus marinus XMU1404]MBW3072964.1 hypothetical protein [Prochlorococcus marinus str. MU1404]MCR8545271.1 hypothetical protein [Prochlorococcus marinus CUG1432]
MGRKLTQTEFLKRCKSIWGDLYDFSRVQYKTSSQTVQVGCKVINHGFWPAQPRALIYKPYRGCPTCGLERVGEATKKDRNKSEDEFIKAKKLREGGLTYKKIAEAMGYKSGETIRNILKVKTTVNDRKSLSNLEEDDVVERSKNGETRASIARLYKVSDGTIRNTLKRKNSFTKKEIKQKSEEEIKKQEEIYESAANKFINETSEDIQLKICNEYKSGKSQKRISKDYKIHNFVLRIFLIKRNIKLRTYEEAKNMIKEESKDIICERYKNGESSNKIADSLGVKSSAITRVLKENNIEIRGTQRDLTLEPQYRKISDDYKNGLSVYQIAKKYEITREKTNTILKHQNVKLRTSEEANRAINIDDRKEIIKLYQEGKSLEYLSNKFNCSNSALFFLFEKEGVKTRTQEEQKWSHGLKANIEIELCEKYKLGKPTAILEKEYGIEASTIFRTLRRNNYEVRDQGNLGDSIQHALNQTGLYEFKKDTSFYIFDLNNYPNYLKPGITFDVIERGKKRWYKNLLLEQVFPSREAAYFVEQVLLYKTVQFWDCPDEIQNDFKWGGRDEVRLMELKDLENEFDYIYSLWEEEGTWLFAANHLPKSLITDAEKELCFKKSRS